MNTRSRRLFHILMQENLKVIVASSGGKVILNSKVANVVSVGKECSANSVHCTLCIKWILKRSGVRGDLCCCCSPFSLVHLSLVILPRDS